MRKLRDATSIIVLLAVGGCTGTTPVARSDNTPIPPIAAAGFYDGGQVPAGISMALMGADAVARFPKGVHNDQLGIVVRGNPSLYSATYNGAVFAFANQADRAAFVANPPQFIPEVGGYCARAMSMRGVTPGDPRNALFVSDGNGGGTWAIFGRPVGVSAWEALAPDKRREAVAVARAYYRTRIGSQAPTAATGFQSR